MQSPFLLVEDESDFTDFDLTGEKDCVVVGLAPSKFNYEVLNEAYRLLNQKLPLIAMHKGKKLQTETGLSLGPGPFVELLERACGIGRVEFPDGF